MTEAWLWGAAGLCAALYGLVLVQRPPSFPRTLVKTVAVGALAVLAYLEGGGSSLAIALALCAVGDAFLAGDPKRWLPFGLAAFLAGHVVYVLLFWRERARWRARRSGRSRRWSCWPPPRCWSGCGGRWGR